MDRLGEVTQLLHALDTNDAGVVDRLFALVYEELRRLASNQFRGQPVGHTLQPTALVNEAYLKLVSRADSAWESRAHFLAVAARAMRQVLIDHARGRATAKRGGELCRLTMDEALTPIADGDIGLLDLESVLQTLATLDERQARIVELRFFGGMTVEEVAHVIGVSKTTVETDWRMARAWLRSQLTDGSTS